ncbi:MAG: hypothetical protein LBF33_01385 [Oscillospiraceae bacterium]|jgi:hypothetical protein|nr:hypothetical protein [Oscillospiraceae bacterium]
MGKKFGEPDREKNILSMDSETLNAITGGTSLENDSAMKIFEEAEKNLEKKNKNG